MTVFQFNTPCFAIADRACDDPIEMAQTVIKSDFGNMGRCVLLFRDRQTAEATARSLGHEIVIEVGNAPFLTLILDAAKGAGCVNIAVDYVRTLDGQACHFHDLDQMFAACRTQP